MNKYSTNSFWANKHTTDILNYIKYVKAAPTLKEIFKPIKETLYTPFQMIDDLHEGFQKGNFVGGVGKALDVGEHMNRIISPDDYTPSTSKSKKDKDADDDYGFNRRLRDPRIEDPYKKKSKERINDPISEKADPQALKAVVPEDLGARIDMHSKQVVFVDPNVGSTEKNFQGYADFLNKAYKHLERNYSDPNGEVAPWYELDKNGKPTYYRVSYLKDRIQEVIQRLQS